MWRLWRSMWKELREQVFHLSSTPVQGSVSDLPPIFAPNLIHMFLCWLQDALAILSPTHFCIDLDPKNVSHVLMLISECTSQSFSHPFLSLVWLPRIILKLISKYTGHSLPAKLFMRKWRSFPFEASLSPEGDGWRLVPGHLWWEDNRIGGLLWQSGDLHKDGQEPHQHNEATCC